MPYNHRLSRPTKHYDESVRPLDEQLCELIAKRKAVSNNNPGFPKIAEINSWAKKYGLYENHLHKVSYCIYNEQLYRPKVEPTGFLGIKPVMKFVEEDSKVFLVTHMRQYENATVLNFQIDSRFEHQEQGYRPVPIQWELSLEPEYDCYSSNGSGNNEQWTQQFVISPRLPDNVEEMIFRFNWKLRIQDEDKEEIGGEVILK